MQDDFIPLATTQEQRDAAALVRYERLSSCTRRWHALAVSMGYEGVEPALLSLLAMKRGPRRPSETTEAGER